jgi:tetratricopeptide (TPR) repeat protein
VILLGGLIAWDISTYMGSRALKVLYNDDGGGNKDPEYEDAEKVWANGQHLEAVRMMREYLNKNPREVHVALRIAEIYEKDLNNFLAAALEYEEVLKTKLPAERWGWAAIHLCNLYFKLGQEVKGYALLQRIVKEYGETQAAEKARKRLKEVDPNLLAEAEPPTAPSPTAAPEPKEEEPKSNLPPGFRPKK